jgi:hypothetical protein
MACRYDGGGTNHLFTSTGPNVQKPITHSNGASGGNCTNGTLAADVGPMYLVLIDLGPAGSLAGPLQFSP